MDRKTILEDRQRVLESIDNGSFMTHFQPIYSINGRDIYGYEALTRVSNNGESISIMDLFQKARLTKTITLLDIKCKEKEKIIFEITEKGVIQDHKQLKAVVNEHRERGYRVAIDDFGTGYCGLKMLSSIEPDYVKIDRYFISNIDEDAINYNLVESIVSVCDKIGVKVIAEGIEREEELKTVTDIGVELVQGHYFGVPSSALCTSRS